jgi:RES domain-containing protein
MTSSWRIVKAKRASQAFDGEGARLNGGRWNSPGTRMVYTAGSTSLAVLEMLVHLNHSALLSSYVLFAVRFDEALVTRLAPADLPAGWRDFPASAALNRLGDRWAAGGASAVLEVPSAIVERERNFLLNPRHPDFPRIAVDPPVPFHFDPRLLGP